MFVCIVVCACIRHALDFEILFLIFFDVVTLTEDITFFFIGIHTVSAPITSGTYTDGGAVIG